jgi:menaquinone-dependent protoporphyrinogen oxidase
MTPRRQVGQSIVVVTAASRHGATRRIATRIADRLAAALPEEWDVQLCEPTDRDLLARADAAVLGSAIYFGRWLKPARRALEHLESDGAPALWLFSSGPVSKLPDEGRRPIAVDTLVDSAESRDHAVFGGRIQRSSLTLLERFVVRMVGVTDVDARDWQAIDDWAATIADALRTDRSPTTAEGRSRV